MSNNLIKTTGIILVIVAFIRAFIGGFFLMAVPMSSNPIEHFFLVPIIFIVGILLVVDGSREMRAKNV